MIKISKITALGIMAVAVGIAALDGEAGWRAARADGIQGINAHVVAANIPGASAIAQIGMFVTGTELLTPGNCTTRVRFLHISPPPPNPGQCWTPTGFWSAAGRISEHRGPWASVRRGRYCRSTRPGRTS